MISLLSNPSSFNDSVAQLDRAFDYESKGRRFESCRGHHCNVDTAIICGVFLFLGNKCQFDTGNIWGKIIKLERKFLRSNFI